MNNKNTESIDIELAQVTEGKSHKKNLLYLSLLFFILFLASVSVNVYFYYQNVKQVNNIEVLNQSFLEWGTKEELSEKDVLKQKEIEYFIDSILPNYPGLTNIPTDSISNIYTYPLKGFDNQSSGRLVEIDGDNNKEFYLVSNLVQIKLENVMVPYIGENALCSTTKVITTGNERNLGRYLQDKNGYIVISGENCKTYGGGSSIAVYSLSTGEKVRLTGEFTIVGTTWNGTTPLGTATGKLLGVFGVKNPKIVVSYGHDSWKGTVEEIRQIAFFDLQTGKLIRVENFN